MHQDTKSARLIAVFKRSLKGLGRVYEQWIFTGVYYKDRPSKIFTIKILLSKRLSVVF